MNHSKEVAQPTERQARAGNYRMSHIRIHGLPITIETPRGRPRKPAWPKMSCDYGYIKQTVGRDGDHVDVFVGPRRKSELVVVIDQVDQSGKFDEHKCLIGFETEKDAVAAYRACFTKGWNVGPVTPLTIKQFKKWLQNGTQRRPLSHQVSQYASSDDVDRYADGGRWITTDNGSHVLIGSDGTIQAGMGGEHNGKKFGDLGKRYDSIESGSTPKSRFVSSTLARIKQHEAEKPQREAEEAAEQEAAEAHPHHLSKLDDMVRHALLSWHMEAHKAVQRVMQASGGAKIAGGDLEAQRDAKRKAWKGHTAVIPQTPEMQRLRDQLRLPPVTVVTPGVDKELIRNLTQQLTEIVKNNPEIKPFIRHNDIVPRVLAARLKPNDSLFRPVDDHERFAAMFADAVVECYARAPKNSPGQMGLFGDGLGSDQPLRSPKTQQRLRWVTIRGSHVLIDGDGVVQGGAGGKLNGKKIKSKGAKKPFVYPNGQTQAVGDDGKPSNESDPKAKPAPKPPVEPKSGSDLFDEPEESDTASPRSEAASAQRKLDSDYEFARASAVSNAGEDLKGSARHVRNQWRSLEEAEADGSAAKLVTRDKLLENEPHELAMHVEDNPIVSLAMHQALKSFPTKPGGSAKDRSDYLDAYRNIKAEAEKIASSKQDDPLAATRALGSAVGREIRRLRGQKGDSMIDAASATDKYNNTANSLIALNRNLVQPHRRGAVLRKVAEFAVHLREKHPDDIKAARKALVDGALAVMEGKSMASVMGKAKKGPAKKKRFDASEAYVAHAKREGGPELKAKTAADATQYMVDKIGLRGVQFGNSVSDKEREHHAKMAAASLVDLADVTGLPIDAISLGGKIGLAMGARGKGRASAHYEPGTQVINLTRKSGVGALAHEWGHAFDHSLTDFNITFDGVKKGADYQSERTSPKRFKYNVPGDRHSGIQMKDGKPVLDDKTNDPVWASMDGVRSAMKASGYDKRLSSVLVGMVRDGKLAQSGANSVRYWRSTREQFARCFERHVQRKLHKSNRENTYLTGLSADGASEDGLWPTDAEVDAMAPAFDTLLDSYRTERLGIKDRVKYSAGERQRLVEVMIERYARQAKNSPGQMGLFGDGLGNDLPLRSAKTQQRLFTDKKRSADNPKLRWVTINGSHVLIDSDGVVQAGAGGKLNGKKVKPKGSTSTGKPSQDRRQKSHEEFLLGKRAGDAKVIAGMLYREIEQKKPVSVIGKTARTAEELAEVAQVYRDPRFETFRAFFVKDGKVVGHNAYSSRLPGVVAVGKHVQQHITDDLKKLGADGFYLLHNHPSGDPEPSAADINLTRQFGDMFGNKLLGHTIIDHTQGTIIERDGEHRKYSLDNENLQDRSKAEVPSDILDTFVNSVSALGELAMRLRPEKGRAVVVFTSVKGKVQMVMDVSKESLEQGETKIIGAMRRVARMTSSDRRFLIVPDGESPSDYAHHMKAGFFTDVHSGEGESAIESGLSMPSDPIQRRVRAAEGVKDHQRSRRDSYVAHHRIDRYRMEGTPNRSESQPKGEQGTVNGRKIITGSHGDRGYFVTIDEHPVFVKANGEIGRGPRSMKGKNVKSVEGKRYLKSKRIKSEARKGDRNSPGQLGMHGETLRSSKSQKKFGLKDSFQPRTQLDRLITDSVGHDPDDVEYFRGLLEDAHKMLSTEANETNDDLRNLLTNFGYAGKRASHLIQQIRRKDKKGGDSDQIPHFDEMVEYAQNHFPHLVGAHGGESLGSGDSEFALWERLRQGFEKPPTKQDQSVIGMALDMFNANGPTSPTDPDYEPTYSDDWLTEEDKRKRILDNLGNPDFVPFAARYDRDVTVHRYGARWPQSHRQSMVDKILAKLTNV